jgi:hypothetical protein
VEDAKAHHHLASMLVTPEQRFKYNDTSYIVNCLEKNGRPILSSETFSSIFKTEEHFNKLKSFLGNYSVHVTLFYREPATLYHSLYTQHIKLFSIPLRPFNQFVEDFYPRYRDVLHYEVIDRYVSAFGRENVTIIDYYGALAENKDLLRVMLCDVYNVLCNASMLPSHKANESPDMLPHHMFYLVRNYMLATGCNMNTNMEPLRMIGIVKKYVSLTSEVPKREVSISMMKEKAKAIDKAVREEYSDIILYNNATASTLARESLTIFEVDEVAFLSSEQWRTWMKREAAELVKDKLMECKLAFQS